MASSLIERAQERRAAAWNRMTEITDRAERDGRDLTAEERASWDAAEKDLTEATADKERAERMAGLESESRNVDKSSVVAPVADEQRSNQPTAEEKEQRLSAAFTNFLKRGIDSLPAEQRSLVQDRFTQLEARAEGVATGSAGGYLVPQGFWQNLVIAMKAYGGLLNEVGVIETATGNPLPWPGSDDTANVGAILGENTQVSQQDIAFTTQTLNAYTYTSKLVLVSLQLLQDSAFNVDEFVTGRLAERIARIQAQHIVSGTGTGQPQGIVTGTTNTTTLPTGNTTTVQYDSLVTLIHSVDPAYRALQGTKFVAHDSFIAAVRKLKDSQGRPLWQPDYLAGADRDMIMGYPVTIDQSLATLAASSTSALFGNFQRGYIWRRVLGLQMLRLTERYADYLQVGFLGFMRGDGRVNDQRAIAALVQSAT
ncbi:MAG: phage major capsid protein [Frankiaceae bacterium]